MENILRNHSNFYAGVKSVLQETARLGGIIGAVSEHLTFDVHYQTALEIALGASSQHIIVEDENAATKAIDFLKRNRAGRATFLPFDDYQRRVRFLVRIKTLSLQVQDFWVWQMSWCRLIRDRSHFSKTCLLQRLSLTP